MFGPTTIWSLLSGWLGLSCRSYLIIGTVIAFAGWSVYVYGAGHKAADRAWRAKAFEAKIAKLELELQVQQQTDAAEEEIRADLDRENDLQKKVIDRYLRELKSRQNTCLLGDDAVRLQ